MRFSFVKKSWRTLQFRLSIGMILITLVLITLMIVNSIYSIDVVRSQVALSNMNMISIYMNQIDNGLNDINQYLLTLQVTDTDLKTIENNQSVDEVLMAKIHFQKTLAAALLTNKFVDSFFVYDIQSNSLMDVFKDGSVYFEREQIRMYLKDFLSLQDQVPNRQTPLWNLQTVGNHFYLFHYLKSENSVIGAWVNINTLQIPFAPINLSKYGDVFFTNKEGTPLKDLRSVQQMGIDLSKIQEGYYISGHPEKFLVVGKPSDTANIHLVAIIPDDKILEDLPMWYRFAIIITIGFFLLLPGFYLFIKQTVLTPLNHATSALRRFGAGEVNFRINEKSGTEEFQTLNQSFNKMADQIEQLKIQIYEEQLNKQNIELQHLQLQINPHFFMNSLNIIFSFASMNKTDSIKEMVMCLVRYFRYMFRSNLTFIPIRDEIELLQNYLKIQDFRYPGKLQYDISVAKGLDDLKIPPLMIHTFVENTVIHQVSPISQIELKVDINLEEGIEDPYLIITIMDTGNGFGKSVLEKLNMGERIYDEDGEHIGIWNVVHRIRLLYEQKATIEFSNILPHGALIKMRLPVLLAEEDDYEDTVS